MRIIEGQGGVGAQNCINLPRGAENIVAALRSNVVQWRYAIPKLGHRRQKDLGLIGGSSGRRTGGKDRADT